MNKIAMQSSAEQVSEKDLAALEKLIGFELPKNFKDFYLMSNGGVPERSWLITDDDYEPMQVADFKYIAESECSDIIDTAYIGACYTSMLSRNVIPHTLLPFAVDDGGNFFCLDLLSGAVVFYAVDTFRAEVSMSVNQLAAQRVVAKTFLCFIDSLEMESGMDY